MPSVRVRNCGHSLRRSWANAAQVPTSSVVVVVVAVMVVSYGLYTCALGFNVAKSRWQDALGSNASQAAHKYSIRGS